MTNINLMQFFQSWASFVDIISMLHSSGQCVQCHALLLCFSCCIMDKSCNPIGGVTTFRVGQIGRCGLRSAPSTSFGVCLRGPLNHRVSRGIHRFRPRKRRASGDCLLFFARAPAHSNTYRGDMIHELGNVVLLVKEGHIRYVWFGATFKNTFCPALMFWIASFTCLALNLSSMLLWIPAPFSLFGTCNVFRVFRWLAYNVASALGRSGGLYRSQKVGHHNSVSFIADQKIRAAKKKTIIEISNINKEKANLSRITLV